MNKLQRDASLNGNHLFMLSLSLSNLYLQYIKGEEE